MSFALQLNHPSRPRTPAPATPAAPTLCAAAAGPTPAPPAPARRATSASRPTAAPSASWTATAAPTRRDACRTSVSIPAGERAVSTHSVSTYQLSVISMDPPICSFVSRDHPPPNALLFPLGEVLRRNAICQCESGFTGDPFSGCVPVTSPIEVEEVRVEFRIALSYSPSTHCFPLFR